MFNEEVLWNLFLMLLCYAYILIVIFVSSVMSKLPSFSVNASRKFLHATIGNLPFVIPVFTSNVYPVLVAVPFVLVTFCVSPFSPFPNIGKRLRGLAGITEGGHKLGLVFYAVSYTILALVFASKPHVIAAGILPMAYGDAAASLIGERYGKRRYKVFANKSLEGSAAMFLTSFFSLLIALVFFSILYSFSVFDKIFAILAAAIISTFVEFSSPLGFDNLFIPVFSALAFLALSGGV